MLSEHGLKIAPSTYYEHPDKKPTPRQVRDQALKSEVARVHAANYGVYGARKVWLQLNREGTRSSGLSCTGLVGHAVDDLLDVGGDLRCGGDGLSSDGDGDLAQRAQGLDELLDAEPGAVL